MATNRLLFIGGTGIISSKSVRLAHERGHDVTVLNRGISRIRPLPEGVRSLVADIRGEEPPPERFDPRRAGVSQIGNPKRKKRGQR